VCQRARLVIHCICAKEAALSAQERTRAQRTITQDARAPTHLALELEVPAHLRQLRAAERLGVGRHQRLQDALLQGVGLLLLPEVLGALGADDGEGAARGGAEGVPALTRRVAAGGAGAADQEALRPQPLDGLVGGCVLGFLWFGGCGGGGERGRAAARKAANAAERQQRTHLFGGAVSAERARRLQLRQACCVHRGKRQVADEAFLMLSIKLRGINRSGAKALV